MSLSNWVKEGKLKTHKTSEEEIVQLLKIIQRDLADAQIQALSPDRRFITAYNAALQLATIVLRLSGFRTNSNKAGHHRITIDALPEILGSSLQDLTDYLNACRIKRNICDYTSAGEISEAEVAEFITEIKVFRELVIERVKKAYPQTSN